MIAQVLGIFSIVFTVYDLPNPVTFGINLEDNIFMLFMVGSIVTNVLLMLLIVGRIIYISQGVQDLTTSSTQKMYQTVISAILESGLLSPVILVLYGSFTIRLWFPMTDEVALPFLIISETLYSILLPTMGIASTLIIVRTAVGIAIEDENSFRATVLGEISEQNVGSIDFYPGMSGIAQNTGEENDVVPVDI
ncbi:hypothetical protein E1B28_005303 [Marasmius oreades]|uniref:Uncharacterized protein n=1 Tax=Marasmius oreades TaxID=181124 RepID=A0A9P8AE53_9AGAR|nr:uncharacterized protein E1B28_005303 [Marasmius oreades]KAG7097995.1 hypothetical protein E1B28_005303 [Marasmius oreades]